MLQILDSLVTVRGRKRRTEKQELGSWFVEKKREKGRKEKIYTEENAGAKVIESLSMLIREGEGYTYAWRRIINENKKEYDKYICIASAENNEMLKRIIKVNIWIENWSGTTVPTPSRNFVYETLARGKMKSAIFDKISVR